MLVKRVGGRVVNEVLMHFRAMKKTAGDVSLSDSLDVDGEGMGVSLMDMLCCEDEALERVGYVQLLQQLRESVDTVLDARQAEVIRLRYGLTGGQPLTQRETAKRLGISRSYISRIEKKALEILQQHFDECI
ncbi:MAG: sigma-70 family RNA polymerase sigma factor [Oscillospiraceae bacterium]|nr:sigma-70 family RNA polymerase sigma factor [Oscillospiraceae bacterium]